MSIIQGNAVSAGGFYPKEIEQSLRLNDDDSAYLSWTPATAGNRKTWTFSTWVKRGNLGTDQGIFGARTDTSNRVWFYFQNTDKLQLFYNLAGSTGSWTTPSVYRDIGAWYHIVLTVDSTQAVAADKVKIYVNGVLQNRAVSNDFAQNADLILNSTTNHFIGCSDGGTSNAIDGYLAETHFIDGTALDATSFGEFKNGVWVAKAFTGTYGTNGFYLPYNNDYTVEGFSATTYRGTEIDNTYIGGVGFEPDLVWIKRRNAAADHSLSDSVRGTGKYLVTNNTSAELTGSEKVNSFDTDGFTISTGWGVNQAGYDYVAWCWDAGTGSPVSNTDGTITSTVKASTDYGFSIVSYTGTGNGGDTVGHGLSSAPEFMMIKNRSNGTVDWITYHAPNKYMLLNLTAAENSNVGAWSNTDPTSSVFSIGTWNNVNTASDNYIAYCFHSVAGYSDFGSYTGTGSAGNTVTTGFRPAFFMYKRTDAADDWIMMDATRGYGDSFLDANSSDAEVDFDILDFTDTGVEFKGSTGNISSATYIYMAFADTREAAFWLDQSGNNNDWENNGLTESDISLDSPTNNFAVMNGLSKGADSTFSQGNLSVRYGSSGTISSSFASVGVSSGKYYFECLWDYNSSTAQFMVGVQSKSEPVPSYVGNSTDSWGYFSDTGNKFNVSGSAYGASYTVGDIIGVALDADAGSITFYKNGISQGVAFSGLTSDTYYFAFGDVSSVGLNGGIANFGQDSSFAGNKVPQGYTDANGRGDFYYAPPAGYLALCTANLPEPAIGPNSSSQSNEHFNTVLYTGDGTSPRSISGVGFQPDLVWQKTRGPSAYDHRLQDVIRGSNKELSSNTTGAEVTDNQFGYLTSFDSDGFTFQNGSTSGIGWNENATTYVAWNWKADNTSGVSNTDGSITSTVSANVDAGFSIVSWTSTGASESIGHGLGGQPELLIFKSRANADGWYVWTTGFNSTEYLQLNSTSAKLTYSTIWSTVPNSTVFGTTAASLAAGDAIAYAFRSVEGFSKFGSYTGNGSTDGPFIFTNFRPAFVMVKRTDSADSWRMYDATRSTYNASTKVLYPNLSNAEDASTDHFDWLSNGFKCRSTNINASGGTYIFMAFAEMPAKYSLSR